MQKSDRITEKTKENILEMKNYAERLSAACDAILNGVPITVACGDAGLDTVRFKRMSDYGFAETKQIPAEPGNTTHVFSPTPAEALWLSVTQKKFTDMPTMPDNLETIWPVAFKEAKLTQKEIAILHAYYWKGMQDAEIGREQRVSRQYINDRRKKAENKLRVRAIGMLTYGLSHQKQLEDLQRKYIQQADKYVRERIDRIRDDVAETLFSKITNELDAACERAATAMTYETMCTNHGETTPVQNANLSRRAENALENSGIHILQQLDGKTEQWLIGLPNIGVKTANEIKSAADRFGVTIR